MKNGALTNPVYTFSPLTNKTQGNASTTECQGKQSGNSKSKSINSIIVGKGTSKHARLPGSTGQGQRNATSVSEAYEDRFASMGTEVRNLNSAMRSS